MTGFIYWPVVPPLRPDGSIDIPALCRLYDEAVNQGASEKPSRIEEDQ